MHTPRENKFYITESEQTATLLFQHIQKNIYYNTHTHITHICWHIQFTKMHRAINDFMVQ